MAIPQGVRWRLLLAFFGISAFAVLAAATAMYSFLELGKAWERIIEDRVPSALASQQLSRQAEKIAAAAPILLTIGVDEEHDKASKKISAEMDRLNGLFADLRSREVHPPTLRAIENLVEWLGVNLATLDSMIFNKIALLERKSELVREIQFTAISSRRLVAPGNLLLESRLEELRKVLEDQTLANDSRSKATRELAELIVLLAPLQNVQSEVSSMSDMLLDAASAESIADLGLLTLPLRRSLSALEDLLSSVEPRFRAPLHARVDEFREIIDGSNSIISAREGELKHFANMRRLLDENFAIAQRLTTAVDGLIADTNRDIRNANLEALSVQRRGTGVLIAVVALSILCSVVIVWLYVGRNLIARLTRLSDNMLAIAGGNLEVDVAAGGNDEIGAMAKALAVFRDTAIEVKETNLREIREARRRLVDAIESISEGFVFYDSDDRLVVSNSRFRELLYPDAEDAAEQGTSFETIIRKAAEKGYIEGAKGRIDEWLSERLAQHRDPGEPQLQRRSDGRWILISERKTENGGIVAVYTDVTELRQAEEAAAESQQFLGTLVDNIPASVFFRDLDGRYVRVNRMYEEIFKVTDESVRGKTLHDVFPRDQADDYAAYDREAIEQHRVLKREETHVLKGDMRTFDGLKFPILDDSGEVIAVGGVDYDITDLKRAEQAATEAEARLTDAIESVSEGFVFYDSEDRLVIHNRPYRELLYPGLEDIVVPGVQFESIVRRAAELGDPEEADGRVEDWVAERMALHRKPGEPQVQQRWDDRWVRVSERKTEGGGIVAVYTDITELKIREAEQAELVEKLKAANAREQAAHAQLETALESMSDALALYDADDSLVLCNNRMRRASGYAEDVAGGVSFEELVRQNIATGVVVSAAGREDEYLAERVDCHRRCEGSMEIELQGDKWLQSRDRRTADGGIVTIQTDITELKRREDELAKTKAILEVTLENMGQGISMFDADLNLIVCNRKFLEMLDIPPEQFKFGDRLEDIFRFKAEGGEYGPGDVEEQVHTRVELAKGFSPHAFERVRPDGRVIEILGHPLPRGGFVSTHTDITARKKAEEALREKTDFLQLTEMITRAANEATSLDAAMQMALDQVCAHTGWPVGHLYTLDELTGDLAPGGIWHIDDTDKFATFRRVTEATRFAQGVGLPGRVLASGKAAWIEDVTKDPNFPRAQLATDLGVKGAFAFPVLIGREIAAVLEFFSEDTAEPYEPLLEVMAQIGTQLGRVIERERSEERAISERLRIDEELQSARELQSAMLPHQFSPPTPQRPVKCAAVMQPAREVGGDFYDVIELDEKRLGIVIADVAGKGAGAALFMARAFTILDATARRGGGPGEVLSHLNDLLCVNNEKFIFVTVFYGMFDGSSGTLTFANAGHNPPFLIRPERSAEPLQLTGGVAVGVKPNLQYREHLIKIRPGDTVFCYTDGITEAKNSLNEEFSVTNLEKVLADCAQVPVEDIAGRVIEEVNEFTGHAPPFDDMTCVVMRRIMDGHA